MATIKARKMLGLYCGVCTNLDNNGIVRGSANCDLQIKSAHYLFWGPYVNDGFYR